MTHIPFITFTDSGADTAMRYADNVQRHAIQLPLALSYLTYSGVTDPNELFNDYPEQRLLYPSGTNITLIGIQTTDRYSGLTATLISGETNLYIQISEYFSDANPAFIGAPYVVSGESSENDLLLATYTADTPENPANYWISLPGPGTYKIAFPFPVVGNSITVTHSGNSPYLLSQLLPRKSVQGYDLEVNSIKTYHLSATVIDTVALRVSESIVVGPELIGEKSIDGSKIIDGTISGVLIRDGTVTGNKVLAGTISGVLLQGSTITGDKLVANTITASKIAAGTITFNEIASNTLTADQIADGAVTGRKILDGTISGVLITDDAISASKIQANAITASKIAAGTITANEIAVSGITAINLQAGAVTADKISARVITAEKIVLSGITADLLGAEAVTAAALASGAVISGKIAANSIYASNIVGGQITAYHVAANTITGDRIQANTISGELITAGTITSTNIAVSGITADRLKVTQLDTVAANMGTLTVNSGISIGANGYIWTGTGSVATPTTGLKIYTTSGISRLTTYAGGLAQVDIASDGKLLAGEGAVILDRSGLTAGKTLVNASGITVGNLTSQLTDASALKIMGSGVSGNNGGISFFNGAYSPTAPQAQITTDAANSFVIANNTPGGSLILQNASTGNNSIYLYNSAVNIMQTTYNTQPASLRGYARDVSGGEIVRYYLGSDKVELYTASGVSTFKANANNGNITTTGDIEALGNIHAGAGDHKFTVNGTTGNLQIGSPPHVFTVNGTTGNTNIEGVLNAKGDIGFGGTYSDKVTIQGTTGNTLILGTLNAQGDVGFGGSYSDKVTIASATGDTAIAGALGVTGQTTLGALNASGAIGFGTSNNKLTVAAATGNTAIAGTLGVTGKITASDLAYITVTRTATLAITTAGTTITWQSNTRSLNASFSTTTVTVNKAGYYLVSGTFATLGNVSLTITLRYGSINYTSNVQGTPLSTGGGYIFNFTQGLRLAASADLQVVLTPSVNTTLNQNSEAFAGASPILNIIQLAGI